ncbi:TetR/AcrR family transcriptional regulator [Tsukamurella sp. 1534]|uniref:TetR/AcrR family transcriptional regulator n=1 Tax=Tsukamurella sp. 1534 TaxID=1151061 RepID=UPI000315A450|nr:TetR/AcrR family transcriptional regulator [Tsukamurella sp. 1534]
MASKTPAKPDTRAQILHAALDWVDEAGLTRISMGALAKRARLARATLYQHFTGKEALIEAVVSSELDKFYARIHDYAEGIADNDERLVRGFGFAYAYLREHRALQRVLAVSPAMLLPYIHGESRQIQQGRNFVVKEIRIGEFREDADVDAFADFFVRQLHSLLLTPLPPVEGLEDPPDHRGPTAANLEAGRRYAEMFVLPARAQFVR